MFKNLFTNLYRSVTIKFLAWARNSISSSYNHSRQEAITWHEQDLISCSHSELWVIFYVILLKYSPSSVELIVTSQYSYHCLLRYDPHKGKIFKASAYSQPGTYLGNSWVRFFMSLSMFWVNLPSVIHPSLLLTTFQDDLQANERGLTAPKLVSRVIKLLYPALPICTMSCFILLPLSKQMQEFETAKSAYTDLAICFNHQKSYFYTDQFRVTRTSWALENFQKKTTIN